MSETCENPSTPPADDGLTDELLTDQELAVLAALRAAPHRVLSRGELSRAAGLSSSQGRRVDVLLVHIRKSLTNETIINIRNRGWRLLPLDQAEAHAFSMVKESA